MAELIGGTLLSASLEVLLDRISSRLIIDYLKGQKLDDRLLTNLRTTMRSVRLLLDDAETNQISKPAVREWLDDIKDAFYQADDFFDEVSFEALRSDLEAGYCNNLNCSVIVIDVSNDMYTVYSLYQVRNFFSSRNPFKKSLKARLLEVLENLQNLVKQKEILGLKEGIGENPISPNVPTTCLFDESGVYGRDEDRDAIIKLLLSDTISGDSNDAGVIPLSDEEGSSSNLGVVPIWGLGGVGKTTLAQLVYNDKAVEERFDVKAWVCVSEEFNVFKITKDILREFGRKTDDKTLNQFQLEIKETLNGKRFLLVLDDVWNENYANWDMLKKPLMYGAHGSWIVVTTRNEGVASMVRTVQPVYLKELNDDACWVLFAKHAFDDGNFNAFPKLEAIGRKILNKCMGLPLAAKSLGGLLRSKREAGEWEKILKSNLWDLPNDEILPALRLSYYNLPSRQKQCFAYSAVFFKDYLFEKEELILLWMAEGFLVPNGNMTMEEVGDGYFNDLVSISFFQRSSLNPSCFFIHDLVNDLAKFVSGDFCFRLEGDNLSMVPKRTRHLSYTRTEYDASSKCESIYEAQLLRTFLLTEWSCIETKVLDDLLPKLRLVRVLSLAQHRNITELPCSIGNLKHLRYLNLSATSIKRLPEVVSTLYNLQILILCHCKDLVELPSNLRKLINLCHLDLRDTKLQRMPLQMGKLTKLEILTDFVIDKQNGASVKELGKLQHLRGQLCITNLQNVVCVEDALDANLKGKENLRELELRWNGDNGTGTGTGSSFHEKDVLEQLQPHTNVECVSVFGYGSSRFPDWVGDSSFSNMVSLKLSGCKNCCSLPPFGQLASLKDLSIKAFDGVMAIGPEFYGCSTSTMRPFAALEILRFETMPQWNEWKHCMDNYETGAFPALRKLYIRECPNLKQALPIHLHSLTTIEIEGCQQLEPSIPRAPSILRLKLKDNFRLLRLAKKANGMYRFVVDRLHCLDSLLEEMKQISGLFTNLEEIEISSCDSLECFPLQSFCKLRILRISRCSRLESLSKPGETDVEFRSLNSLEIKECPNLMSLYRGGLSFPNLTRLLLLWCPDIESFPGKMVLSSSLTSLKIFGFENLKSLDYKGIQNLASLGELEICNCPKLQCIPEEGLPISLYSLSISLCPLLEKRCQREEGEDWSKISHLRNLEVNFQKVN
ncbi:putative disease resistance protein At3g14460 [Euphorbia lathyris]|uniref:putative disease resistance protein At3g14460 n=1 Tax=Euphorbia lathyris TaxID=212925 RepID=UPI003313D6F7